MAAAQIIELLDLVPHPEGGHYRRTFADASSSAIYYLIEGDAGWTQWHRVLERTEVWHFYAGAPLDLEMTAHAPGSTRSAVRLGPDLAREDVPQAVVPPGCWQRARSSGPWSLAGCTVSPPFTFDAFELRAEPPS
jgi:predicted cupin superfamily sugar epimerase